MNSCLPISIPFCSSSESETVKGQAPKMKLILSVIGGPQNFRVPHVYKLPDLAIQILHLR